MISSDKVMFYTKKILIFFLLLHENILWVLQFRGCSTWALEETYICTQVNKHCEKGNIIIITIFLHFLTLLVTSFLSLVPTLDGYTDHVNSQTIDLYLDGESPKLNFRVDKKMGIPSY